MVVTHRSILGPNHIIIAGRPYEKDGQGVPVADSCEQKLQFLIGSSPQPGVDSDVTRTISRSVNRQN